MSVVELSPSETQEIRVIDPRVERSARILDELKPGWADKIDLDNFDIQNPRKCVMHYAYKRWWNSQGFSRGMNDLKAHGYSCLGLAFAGPQHNDDWRLEIQARKTR